MKSYINLTSADHLLALAIVKYEDYRISLVLRVIGMKRWKSSRIVSFIFVSCALLLLASFCLGTMAQDPPLRWYNMSGSSNPISGNPTDQHGFDVAHTTNIVQCNLTIDGSNRTYLAYDSDSEGNNISLYYSDSITGIWTPYSLNPVLASTNGSFRTPSVVYTGGVFEMFLNNITNKDVERWTSTDGINFTYQETLLTSPDDPWTNPFVWLNPNDSNWYLFWADGNNTGETWTIYARNSSSITDLAHENDTLVMSCPTSSPLRHMSFPTVMYRDGHYWLLCEALPSDTGPWEVGAFVSTSVTSGYAECPNSPILTNSEACPQIFIADDNVSCYLFADQNSVSWYQEEFTVYGGYYLTVETSPLGVNSPSGEGWYDSGSLATISTPQDVDIVAGSSRYDFRGWTGDPNITDASSPSTTVLMDGAKTVTANYVIQYKLTMSTDFGTTSPSVGDNWYDNGSVVTISATAPSAGGGEQYVWNGWTGTGSDGNTTLLNPAEVTMNSAVNETASWTHQYQVSFQQTGISSDAGSNTVLTLGGSDYAYDALPTGVWVDNGTTFSWASTVAGVTGERFNFIGDNAGLVSPITAPGTDAATYGTQYLVSFTESGLDSDAGSNTVLSVGATNYVFTDFNISNIWVDNGTSFSWTATVSGGAGKQFVLTGVSGLSSPILASGTSSATYKTQYYVTLAQSSVGTDFSGTVVTVNGTGYGRSGISFWTDSGDNYVFSYASPLSVDSGKQYVFLTANESSPLTVSGAETVTGSYKTQYYVTFAQSGVDVDFSGTVVTVNGTGYDRTGISFWADSGDIYNFSFSSPLVVTVNVKQYVLTEANATSPFTVSASETTTGVYKTQWYMTFTQSGLDGSATGTVVTVNSTAKGALDLPYSLWVNDSDVLVFNYESIVGSNAVNKQFMLSGLSASSPLTVTDAQTIMGTYKTQWYVTFAESGLDGTASGTVVTVNGSAITHSSLPYSLWVNSSGSLVFGYANVSSTVSGVRFIVDSVNATSPLTVTGSVTIMGTYKIQYYVSFAQTGVGSDFSGNVMVVNGTGYDRAGYSDWYDSGASIPFNFDSPLIVAANVKQYALTGANETSPLTVSGAETVTGSYKIQWYVTVTSAHGGPTASSGWVDAGSNFTVSVTAPEVVDSTHQWNLTGLVIDGLPATLNNSVSFTGVASAHSVEFDWTEQWYISVTSLHGSPTESSQWVNASSSFIVSVTNPDVVVLGAQQWNLTGLTVDGVVLPVGGSVSFGSVVTNHTIEFDWTEQWYLTVDTSPSGVNSPTGQGWYNASSLASISTDQYVDILSGSSRYSFSGWTTSNMIEIADPSSLSTTVLMDEAKTVTANYVTQYNVTFGETGLDGTATGTIVTVNGSTEAYGSLPFSMWVNSSDSVAYSYGATVSSNVSGKQFRLDNVTGPTSPINVTSPVTVTGNYVTQYQVTFGQKGANGDFTGTLLTVEGVNYDLGNVSSAVFWWDAGSSHTFVYQSPLVVSANVKQYMLVSVNASSPYTVSSSATVTSTYKTQYFVTFAQSGVGTDFSGNVMAVNGTSHDRNGTSFWADSGDLYNFAYSNPLSVNAGKQYALTSVNVSSPLTVSAATTVTGSYKTQWYMSFAQSGLDGSATGTVVTVNGTTLPFGSLPYSVWVNDSDVLAFNYESIVASSTANKQFILAGVNASSPLTVTGAQTVTGAYTVQYYVTFAESGLDGTAAGTVVTVNGSAITYSSLPHSLWVNSSDSLVFNYANVSSTVSGTRFIVDSVNATSPLTVAGPLMVMGNYLTQYYISFNVSGVDSDFSGNVMTVGATGYDRSGHADWYDNGSSITFAYLSPLDVNSGKRYVYISQNATSPLTASMAETVTGTYKTQYYVIFSQSGVGSDFSGDVMLVDSVNYSRAGNSGWYDNQSSVTFSFYSPLVVNSSERYVFVSMNETSPLTVSSAETVTGTYKTQWYISVTSLHGSPTESSQWVDDGSSFNVSVINPDVVVPSAHQWNLTGLIVDGTPQTLANSVSFGSVTANHTIEFDWTENFYITVNANGHGSPTEVSTWVAAGSNFTVSVTNPDVVVAFEHQWNLTALTVDSVPQTLNNTVGFASVNASHTIVFSWTEQWYLTVDTNPSSVNSPTGAGWYDTGVTAHVSTDQYVDVVPGSSRYRFNSWAGASGTFADATVTMDSAKTATANYIEQYYVTFAQSGVGVDFVGAVMNVSSVNYTRSGYSNWFDSGTIVSFNYYSPLVVNATNQYVWGSTSGLSTLQSDSITITASGSVVGNYGLQNAITFNQFGLTSDFTGTVLLVDGTPYNVTDLPVSFLWSINSVHTFAYQSPLVVGANSKQYVWTGTTGLSSLQGDSINVTTFGSITGTYKTQYYVTFAQSGVGVDFLGSVMNVDLTDYGRSGHSGWYDSAANITFFFYSPEVVTADEKQYVVTDVNASSPLTVSAAQTVTGTYKTQYWIVFAESGVGSDFSGSVMNVNGTDYGRSGLSGWYDSGASLPFSYYSPLNVNSGERYVLLTVNETSPPTVSRAETVTGSYNTQYYLTVVTSPSNVDSPSGQGWYNASTFASISTSQLANETSSSRYNFTGWTTGNMTEIASPSSLSTTVLMDEAKTVTANYLTQYNVTFIQSGVNSDFNGTVMTVNGTGYDRNGVAFWAYAGDVYNFNYSTPLLVSANQKQYVFVSANASSPYTVSGSATVTGTFKTQWYITFAQSGVGSDFTGTVMTVNGTDHDRNGTSFWADSGDVYNFSYASPLNVTLNVKQYAWIYTGGLSGVQSGFISVSSSGSIIGHYATQYNVTFAQSGLDGTATGTVVTVNGSAITHSSLPYNLWVNSSDSLIFGYANVSSTVSGMRFIVDSVNASSPLTVTGPVTVMGNYLTQYYITFAVSGVGSDFSGNVMTVGATGYDRNGNSDWYDNGSSITFAYLSPLNVNSGKRYVYVSQNATSSLTVSMAETVTGTYKTQWYVTVTSAHGSPTEASQWVDDGSSFNVSVTNPDVVVPSANQWNLTGLIVGGVPQALANSVFFGSVTTNRTIEFDWTQQWYISVTSAHGSPTEASQWVNDGAAFSVSVTNPDVVVPSAQQWNLTGLTVDTVPQTLNNTVSYASVHAAHTIEFDWTEQWYVTFNKSGVGSDFTGTVVTVDSVDYGVAGLPVSFWWDNGSGHSFSFASPLVVDVNKQYSWSSTSGLSSFQSGSLTVTASGSVVGNYIVQNQVTFDQLGASSDFNGTVLIVDGTSYNVTDLPVSFSWSIYSVHTFAYQSPLAVGVNSEQYVWTGTTGLSSLEGGSINVTTFGSITATYKTQYYVTFAQSGVGSDFSGDVMNVGGVNYTRVGHSGWYDNQSSVTFSFYSPLVVNSSERYVFVSMNETSPLTVSTSETVTGTFKTQWYITVTSAHGSPTASSGWVDAGSNFTVSVTNPDVVVAFEHQWNLTGLKVDGVPQALANSVSFVGVAINHTVEFDWTEQWYVSVTSAHGNPSESSQWVDDGAAFSVSVTNPDVVSPGAHQWNLTGLAVDSVPQTLSNTVSYASVHASHTIVFSWTEQWYITVTSAHDTPTASGWVDNGSGFAASVSSPADVVAGDHQWVCTGYSIDGGASTPGTGYTFTSVQANHTILFGWSEQFWIAVTSAHDSPTASAWVDSSGSFNTSVTSPTEVVSGDHQWVCTGYKLDNGSLTVGTSYNFTSVASAHSIEFDWKEQFYLTVTSAYDTAGGAGWYDNGSTAYATLTDGTVPGSVGTQYVFTSWGADASGTNYAQSNAITMNGPKTATATWTTQYLVTYSATGNVLPVTVPSDEWVNSSGSAVGVFPSQVTVGGTRCNFVSDNRTVITSPSLIVGTYQTQYFVTFAQSGLDGTASGTVVTVNGSAIIYSGLPYSLWVNSSDSLVFIYANVSSTASREQFRLDNVTGPTSPINVTSPVTVTGNYVTQYQITFGQTGANVDFTSTLLTVDGVNYGLGNISSAVFWWDAGSSHTFVYQSPLVVTANVKQYLLVIANASSSYTVSGSATVTGTYVTQWYISITSAHGSPTEASQWVNDSAAFSVSVINPDVVVVFEHQWNLTALTVDTVPQTLNNTVSYANVNASHTIVFSWTEQWYITVTSAHDTPTASGWVDNGSSFAASVSSPADVVAGDHRWVCTGYSIDGGASAPGTGYTFTSVQANHTILFGWSEQFWIEVDSAHDSPTSSGWVDSGGNFTASVTSPADIVVNVTQWVCTGYIVDNGSLTAGTSYNFTSVASAHTIEFDWKEQFYVTFNKSGVGSDFTGTVVTVDSVDYGVAGLPVSFWWDNGSGHSFSFASPLVVNANKTYSWSSTSGLSSLQSGTLPVTASGSVVGSYIVQNSITFDQVGVSSDFNGTVLIVDGNSYNVTQLPVSFTWNIGSNHTFAYQSPLVVGANSEQYVWTGTTGLSSSQSGTITVTTFGSITGNYKTQYYVTFAQSGVGTDFSGSVMNVGGTDYNRSGYSNWYDNGANITFFYYSPLVVTADEKRYVVTDVNASSALTVSAAQTVTGTYETQYYVTFAQSGVGVDFSGTVMTVNGVDYGSGGVSFWADSGNVSTFNYASPLLVSADVKQYVLTGVSGNSTDTTLTVAGAVTVTGSYKTQYFVTFAQSGVGSDFGGTVVSVNGTDHDRFGISFWANSSDVYDFTFNSPLVVTVDIKQYVFTGVNESSPFTVSGAETVTGRYYTQYYLTVVTSPSNVDSPSGQGWYNASTFASISTSQFANETGSSRYNFTSWTTGNMSEITSPSSLSTTVMMDSGKTVTANYVTQFNVTINESGVGSDFTGTVVTIDSSDYDFTSLPASFWWDNASLHIFVYQTPLLVAANVKQYVFVMVNASSSFYTVNGSATITGTYKTQWYIAVTSAQDTPTPSAWVDNGTDFSANVTSPTETVPDISQWVCTGYSVDGGSSTPGTSYVFSTVVVNHTIIFGWQEQFWIVFNQSGVSSDYSANLMTINGTGYDRSGTSFWANSGDVYNFGFSSPLLVTANVKQYIFVGANESSPFTVSGAETVTGTYETQYYVTFAQSGVGSDFSGTVVTVNGTGYDRLGTSFWANSGDVYNFTYASSLVVTADVERYAWTSTGGLSGIQNGSITILGSGSVTGNYVTEYYVTFTVTGLDITATGTVVTVNGSAITYSGLPDSLWVNSSDLATYAYESMVSSSVSGEQFRLDSVIGPASPITVTAAAIVTGNYVTQYQVSFAVSPSGGGSTIPTGFNVWEDAGSLPISATGNPSYVFLQWSSDTGSIAFVNSITASTTATIGGPGTITADFGNTSLVVRGDNNLLYYRYFSSSVWGGWNVVPSGTTGDSPATTICSGAQYFIVRGMDGYSLWFSWINQSDGSFSGWTWISGSTPSPPTLTANGTALALMVRGSDNAIYYRIYDTLTQTWNDWVALPGGTTCDTPAVAMLGNTLHIVVRGFSTVDAYMNNTLWYSTLNLTDDAFSGWTLLLGSTPSTPTLAASATSDTLYVVVRGDDNSIYMDMYNDSGWQGWTVLASGSTPNAPAATVTGTTLNVVVIGMDGNSMWQSSLNLVTNEFSGWTWISGSTPSIPKLTS